MKIKYYFDEINNEKISLFLAGPTPRNDKVESWRKEAIKYLNDFKIYKELTLLKQLLNNCLDFSHVMNFLCINS